ncbi:unnamed protein product [Caenorhabditis sp. 36 PRJEB53466]|nr:unnamed protein product [Caenorhabditis sp. 36 PRJEB53466]
MTGALPRRHGLIGDHIYNWKEDLKFQNFTADSDFSRDWWKIDPIYTLALRSAATVAMFFFPECDVDWDVVPQICVPPRTDGRTFADESQAKRVVQATKDHDLVLVYHPWIGEEIRRRGVHHTGEKQSKEVPRFAASLERLTAQARERVDLNVIVVSTHGFIDVPRKNIRVLDEYIPMELIETTIGSGAIKQLMVKKGKTHQVYSQLHHHNPIPNVRVYYTNPKSGDLPEHFHLKKSDTVADLVLLADPGFAVVTKDETKQFPKPKLHEIPAAIDGYNNELPDVLGVFLGYGPAFRVGYRKGPVQLFDVYSLMCSLLSIECNPTPGRILRIDDVLTALLVALRLATQTRSLRRRHYYPGDDPLSSDDDTDELFSILLPNNSTPLMELSQELISIAVIFAVCAVLSIVCTCIWLCRCRKDQIRASEEKHDRAVQLQNFEQEQAKNGSVQASLKAGKRLDIIDIERSTENVRISSREDSSARETIGQYEERVTGGKTVKSVAQRFKDKEQAENKRLDTISEMAVSNDSLQRNDSKTNVFNNNESRHGSSTDVDLNPGLSSTINLEKI